MRLPPELCLLVALVGCDPPNDKPAPPPAAKTVAPAPAAEPAPTPTASASAPAPPSSADQALKRTYGPKELKLMPCATLESPEVIRAMNCQTGFVVYGPYATVPAGSKIELSFEVEASTTLNIESELVSEMGKYFYGALPAQAVEKGTRRSFALRVPITSRVAGLEARVIVSADTPVSFKIHRMNVKVL